MSAVILDTGPLVAYLVRSEALHEWAKARFLELRVPLLTCEAVLAEAMFILRRAGIAPQLALSMITRGIIVPSYDLRLDAEVLFSLMERYKNVPMSLADACLVRMSEIHDGARVMTMDSDFTVYRKFGRQVIPVIMPD